MTKEKRIIKASEGFVLQTKYGIFNDVILGTSEAIIDGKIVQINFKEDEIKEVRPVFINDTVYYISSTNYADAVSELIRQKYSLDNELALIANARLNINQDKEEQFQNWRAQCKAAAKKIFK